MACSSYYWVTMEIAWQDLRGSWGLRRVGRNEKLQLGRQRL